MSNGLHVGMIDKKKYSYGEENHLAKEMTPYVYCFVVELEKAPGDFLIGGVVHAVS